MPGLSQMDHSFVDMGRFNMLDSVMQIKVNYFPSVRAQP